MDLAYNSSTSRSLKPCKMINLETDTTEFFMLVSMTSWAEGGSEKLLERFQGEAQEAKLLLYSRGSAAD